MGHDSGTSLPSYNHKQNKPDSGKLIESITNQIRLG